MLLAPYPRTWSPTGTTDLTIDPVTVLTGDDFANGWTFGGFGGAIAAGASRTVQLTWLPTTASGVLESCTLVIVSDDLVNGSLRVTAQGTPIGPPSLVEGYGTEADEMYFELSVLARIQVLPRHIGHGTGL